MKIAIVTAGVLPVPPVKGGAVENLVYSFIKQNELSESPIEIDVFGIEHEISEAYPCNQKYTSYHQVKISKTYDILEKTKINTIMRLVFKKYRNYPYLPDVLMMIKGMRYDYIIVENRPWFVEDIKKVTDAKIILHMHNDHLCLNVEENKHVIKDCYKILVVSQYLKKKIIENFNIEYGKVEVLENGIDYKLFSPIESNLTRNRLRKSLNIKESDFVIVFSGRLVKEKGILEVISSFKQLLHRENIKLLILGANTYSSDLDDPFAKELVSLTNNLKDRIIFTGYIDYYKMPNYYSIGDIALLPSIWQEPSGLVILESMSMQLPVITTNVGGIPELLPGSNFILNVDEHLEKNIISSIEQLYSNKELRDQLGIEGRNRVINYYTEEIYYNNFIELLNKG